MCGWFKTQKVVVAVPAETHQLGRDVGPAIVAEYLHTLLDDDNHSGEAGDVTLGTFGVRDEDLEWLWEAVCEEFAERTVAPEFEPGLLTPALTVEEAAKRITVVLGGSGRDAHT